jgi:hypothetical protein
MAEQHPCLVCAARGTVKIPSPARVSKVTIQARSLVLCREHAALVAIRMPRTWAELCAIFAIAPDRRSPIPRRGPEGDDRRILPPRPEGRRRSPGRRSGDPRD